MRFKYHVKKNAGFFAGLILTGLAVALQTYKEKGKVISNVKEIQSPEPTQLGTRIKAEGICKAKKVNSPKKGFKPGTISFTHNKINNRKCSQS